MRQTYLSPPKLRLSGFRLGIVSVALLLAALSVIVLGAWRISNFEPKLKEQLKNAYNLEQLLHGHRGTILDRNGALLAMNANVYDVSVNPHVLRREYAAANYPPLAAALGEILEVDKETILKKISRDTGFVYLQKKITPEKKQKLKEKLKELGIKSIKFKYISKRFYPNREVAAPLVGYINESGGQGVDFARHRNLRPTEGEISGLRASDGRLLKEYDATLPKNGNLLDITIDLRLQIIADEAVRKALAHNDARSASAVVMDATTGDILALANAPGFNPNNILESDLISDEERTKNRVIADSLECGSTIKPFVVALALKLGLTKENEILPTSKSVRVSRHLTVRDKHIRKDINVSEVLTRSSNVGAYILARRIGKKRYHDFLQEVGFGGEKIFGLNDETLGKLRHHKKWRKEDFATHAYGYGFSATLMQLLRAYSIFSSDGLLVEPRLVSSGKPFYSRVIPAHTARRVRKIMTGVINGTAPKAAVFGYQIAGKTGTADKFVNGQYDKDLQRAFFVGMAPAKKPRYLIAIVVDEPKGKNNGGGAVAAPIFSEIMRQALLFGGIPPFRTRDGIV